MSTGKEPHAPQSPNENHAIAVLERIKTVDVSPKVTYASRDVTRQLPTPSLQRKRESLNETPLDLGGPAKDGQEQGPETVFYLAYGSNLCAETFQGTRGIRPLSQANVVVPELVRTFDLPGLPYLEPCFANTSYRVQTPSATADEKAPTLSDASPAPRYRKLEWKKGLVGVVYEITTKDYAHLTVTEGGGTQYQDILVDCYELPAGEDTVPLNPTSPPFKAHTLYTTLSHTAKPDCKNDGRIVRLDPNYAQPSQRYLSLITSGADELVFPKEYKEYLRRIRPYILTTKKQMAGRFIFLMVWLPLVFPLYGLNRIFADKQGRSPPFLGGLLRAVFGIAWRSYDAVFKPIFGDGERTISDRLDQKPDVE